MPIDGIGCDGAFNVSTATPLLKKVQLYPCYCFAFSPSWFSGFNLFRPLFPYSANANFSSGSTARPSLSFANTLLLWVTHSMHRVLHSVFSDHQYWRLPACANLFK